MEIPGGATGQLSGRQAGTAQSLGGVMKPTLNRRNLCLLAANAGVVGVLDLSSVGGLWARIGGDQPSPQQAEEIAKEAYVYLYPLVQNYLSIYQLALDPSGSQ